MPQIGQLPPVVSTLVRFQASPDETKTTALGLAPGLLLLGNSFEAGSKARPTGRTTNKPVPPKRRQPVYKGRALVEFYPIAVFPKPRSRLD